MIGRWLQPANLPLCEAYTSTCSMFSMGDADGCRRSRPRRRHRCCGVLPLLCVAMLLVTVALATWALVEGLRGTHHQVDDFWAIEQSIRDQVCDRDRSLTLSNATLSKLDVASPGFVCQTGVCAGRAQISSLRQNVLTFFGGIASIQQAVSALSTALTGAAAYCRPARHRVPAGVAVCRGLC